MLNIPGQQRYLFTDFRHIMCGEIRVSIFETPSRSIEECSPLNGDDPALTVHWSGQTDIGAPEGQPVILQFKQRHGELFGFEWA